MSLYKYSLHGSTLTRASFRRQDAYTIEMICNDHILHLTLTSEYELQERNHELEKKSLELELTFDLKFEGNGYFNLSLFLESRSIMHKLNSSIRRNLFSY